MKPTLFATRPKARKPLNLKPVEGMVFVDLGAGGTLAKDAAERYRQHWERHPNRLRKGEAGAVELVKQARDRR